MQERLGRERPRDTWIRLVLSMLGFVLMAWLALSGRPEEPPSPLAAHVEPGSAGLTFALANAPPDAEPVLSVFSDTDLQYFLRPTDRKDSRWLPNLALSKFPAVMLTYRWEAGSQQVSGEYLYIHKDYPYPWKVEEAGGLTVYYATGVVGWRVERWVGLNDWLPRFLGTPQQPVVIYAMPDEESYARIIKGYSHLGKASAFYSGTRKWVVLRPGQGEDVVVHELGHAYLASGNPIWWEEGIATWVELQHHLRTSPEAPWLYWKERLAPLVEQAAKEPVTLGRVDYDSAEPLDPYRVGLSFCLFIEERFGTEALKRLAVAARQAPLEEALPKVLGEDPVELLDAWQRALADGEILRWLEQRAQP